MSHQPLTRPCVSWPMCCGVGRYPFPLLVLLLGLSYAVLAPLVLLFMTLYFLLAYPVWLHQLLYVYQPSSHTGASQVMSLSLHAQIWKTSLKAGWCTRCAS